jgi:hypothetical protein
MAKELGVQPKEGRPEAVGVGRPILRVLPMGRRAEGCIRAEGRDGGGRVLEDVRSIPGRNGGEEGSYHGSILDFRLIHKEIVTSMPCRQGLQGSRGKDGHGDREERKGKD